MEMLASTVRHKTTISDGYRKHAGYQSMEAYATDWRVALRRLERQVLELEEMARQRKVEQENGDWPANLSEVRT
jgi:hypothetical protein